MSSLPPARPATILVAEDDPEVLRFVLDLLHQAGYVTLAGANGALALAAAIGHAGVIDLLITDVVMPVMPGPELARRFHLCRPNAKILFMSGFTDRSAVEQIEQLPGAGYLRKPFRPNQLLAQVEALLHGE